MNYLKTKKYNPIQTDELFFTKTNNKSYGRTIEHFGINLVATVTLLIIKIIEYNSFNNNKYITEFIHSKFISSTKESVK